MPKRWLVVIVGAILVGSTVVACGQAASKQALAKQASANPDAALTARARESLMAGFQPVVAVFPVALRTRSAGCIVNAMLTTVGVQRLIEYGILNRDGSAKTAGALTSGLTMTDAQRVSGALFECLPMTPVIAGIQRNLDRQLPPGVRPKQEQCLNASITRSLVLHYFALAFTGHPDAASGEFRADVSSVARRCSGPSGTGA